MGGQQVCHDTHQNTECTVYTSAQYKSKESKNAQQNNGKTNIL